MLKPTHRTKSQEVHAVQWWPPGDPRHVPSPFPEFDKAMADRVEYRGIVPGTWIIYRDRYFQVEKPENFPLHYEPIQSDPRDEAIRELARVCAMLLRGLPDNDYARSLSANPIALAAIEAARKERA